MICFANPHLGYRIPFVIDIKGRSIDEADVA